MEHSGGSGGLITPFVLMSANAHAQSEPFVRTVTFTSSRLTYHNPSSSHARDPITTLLRILVAVLSQSR